MSVGLTAIIAGLIFRLLLGFVFWDLQADSAYVDTWYSPYLCVPETLSCESGGPYDFLVHFLFRPVYDQFIELFGLGAVVCFWWSNWNSVHSSLTFLVNESCFMYYEHTKGVQLLHHLISQTSAAILLTAENQSAAQSELHKTLLEFMLLHQDFARTSGLKGEQFSKQQRSQELFTKESMKSFMGLMDQSIALERDTNSLLREIKHMSLPSLQAVTVAADTSVVENLPEEVNDEKLVQLENRLYAATEQWRPLPGPVLASMQSRGKSTDHDIWTDVPRVTAAMELELPPDLYQDIQKHSKLAPSRRSRALALLRYSACVSRRLVDYEQILARAIRCIHTQLLRGVKGDVAADVIASMIRWATSFSYDEVAHLLNAMKHPGPPGQVGDTKRSTSELFASLLRGMLADGSADGWVHLTYNLQGARSKRKELSAPTKIEISSQAVDLRSGKLKDTRPFILINSTGVLALKSVCQQHTDKFLNNADMPGDAALTPFRYDSIRFYLRRLCNMGLTGNWSEVKELWGPDRWDKQALAKAEAILESIPDRIHEI